MKPYKKINVLFVLQTFGTGGSERIVKILCEKFDPMRFRCFVVALTGGEMQKEFLEKGIPAYCVNKRGNDTTKIMRRISRVIEEKEIHIINAHHFTPLFHSFYGAKKNRCKIVYTAHSCNEVDRLSIPWPMAGRMLLSFSSGAIGISPEVSESIAKKFKLSRDKIITIVNAIDHSRFMIDLNVREKKKSLGLKHDERIIGSVGNLRYQKNYPNLIKAFKIIRENVKDIKLVIVGEGKRRNDLEVLVGQLGLDREVLLLGARLDVPEILKIMDLYCLASHHEGLPMSLLEAMSAGVPVVGTDVPGIRNVIKHRTTGLLVPSDAPIALSKALVELLENPAYAKMLSNNAYRYVREEHSMRRWISAYEVLFEELSGHKHYQERE